MLRFENGFEIRDLHHFASKNVPHTASQILKVTEIQQFRSNQLMLKIVIFKNFKFAPIRKRFRDSGSASLCEQKCPPHHLSNPQGYRDTTIQVKSADVEKSLFLKISNLLRFENGFEIRDLHHFASKNVPHTASQILKVTEIQQFRSNQLMLKIVIFKNFKFAPIRKRFRDSGSASLCEQKCPPHHLSNPQGYRDTTI